MNKRFLLSIMPLFCVIFLDMLGSIMVIPLLPAILEDPATSILPLDTTEHMRNIYFGLAVSGYPLMMFFGAPILGDLSDQVGRKKVLLICLIGSSVGYAISGMAIPMHSMSLFVLGRAIDGFTAGSIAIAQAAIIDISPPELKTKNIGYILLASSLGFIIGPITAGVLNNPNLGDWFTLTTPFYFAAILSIFNIALLLALFTETFTPDKQSCIRPMHSLKMLVRGFRNPDLRLICASFLSKQLGWALIFTYMPLYLAKLYHYDTLHLGLYNGLIGVGFSIALIYLMGKLSERFSLIQIISVSLVFCILFTCGFVLVTPAWSYWVLATPFGIALALAYTSFISLFSDQIDKLHQGYMMGLSTSLSGFAHGINGFILAYVANISLTAPLWLAVINMVIAFLLSLVVMRHIKVKS